MKKKDKNKFLLCTYVFSRVHFQIEVNSKKVAGIWGDQHGNSI